MTFDEYFNKGIDAFECGDYEIAAAIFLGYILGQKNSIVINNPSVMPYSDPFGTTKIISNNNEDSVKIKYSDHT